MMDGVLYVTVSLIGVVLCHLSSEGICRTYRNNPIKIKFTLYYILFFNGVWRSALWGLF